jgi:hypothetical protein
LTRLKNTNPLTLILSLSLILLSFSAFNYCAAQEVKSAPGQGGIQSPPGQPGNAAVTADKTAYKVIPIRMEMEAGAAQYKQWPGGQKTIHAGIGWIHPFGRGEYVAGKGFPEADKYPIPSYFNEEWMKTYETDLFCIYMLKDGNIYAYDGVVGNLEPADGDDGKMDYLVNVIVGGTGAYEGATGMLLGRTPGKGKSTQVAEELSLPVSILKLMEGYIRIPVKK